MQSKLYSFRYAKVSLKRSASFINNNRIAAQLPVNIFDAVAAVDDENSCNLEIKFAMQH